MATLFKAIGRPFQSRPSAASANNTNEIKTALQVAISGREERDGVTYYAIKIWLVYSPEKVSKPILRRYRNFEELQASLEAQRF